MKDTRSTVTVVLLLVLSLVLGRAAAETAAPASNPEPGEVTLESVVRYLLSPGDDPAAVRITDMGQGAFFATLEVMVFDMDENTVYGMASREKTYLGMVANDGDSFWIQLISADSGESYSPAEPPYDYDSQEFKNVLNYLLKDDGNTIVSVTPESETVLSALDASGHSYSVEVVYAEAGIMIGLLRK